MNYRIYKRTTLAAAVAASFVTFGMQAAQAANPVPEEIDFARVVTTDDSHIYYAQNPDFDTNPCLVVPDAVVYGRVPHGGGSGDEEQLETGCDAIAAEHMVATEHFLYYTIKPPADTTRLYRIPIDGGVPELLHNAGHSVVAKDDDFVYFFQTGALVRFPHDDPASLEFITNALIFSQINDLITSGGWVFWTESNDLGGGAVRTVAKSGGPIGTLADAGVEMAWDADATDDYIYWSELGGRIRRYERVSGIIDTLYQHDQPVYGIDVEDGTLAFTRGYKKDGTVWRMPADGGTATLMAFDQAAPKPVVISDGYVYWVTEVLKRLPLDAEADGVDYIIDRMEVTQGLQDGFHSVPMATDKMTYVRVYPRELVGPATTAVRAQLHGSSGGVPLPGSPISPVSAPVNPDADIALRANVEDSLVFALPRDWVNDSLSLQAEINPVKNGEQAFENNYTNNLYPGSGQQAFTLEPRSVCVVTLGVAALTEDGGEVIYENHTANYHEQLARGRSLLPGIFVVEARNNILRKGNGDAFNLTQEADRVELMSQVAAEGDWDANVFSCSGDWAVYTGMVDNEADTYDVAEDFTYGGVGSPSLQSNWTRMFIDTGHEGFNQPRGGVTLGHEIGHVVGLPHSPCGGPANPGPYPYPDCQLDDSNAENAHWGFDGLSMSVIHPTDGVAADLMSYNYNRWPSDFTWRAVDEAQAAFVARGGARSSARLPENVVWVRGQVGEAIGDSRLYTAFHLPSADMNASQLERFAASEQLASQRTRFALELLDDNNAVVATQPIRPEALEEGPGSSLALFNVVMPFDSSAQTLRLVDRTDATKPVYLSPGNSAPVLHVAANEAGDQLDIDVSAFDDDADSTGDAPRFIVQYSANSGASWQSLAVDRAEQDMQVELASLAGTQPGSDSLVRVYASDGLNTTSALSAPFQVDPKAPVPFILSPKSGEEVSADGGVLFRGAASDTEQDANSLFYSWYLNGELIGHGPWLSTDILEKGLHSVQLVVHDADQMSNADTVRFEVR